jgi:hypothetical protein
MQMTKAETEIMDLLEVQQLLVRIGSGTQIAVIIWMEKPQKLQFLIAMS